MIYVDNAATTKIHPEALKSLRLSYEEFYGNPSSMHSFGNESEKMLEKSRKIIADFINCNPEEIYFTSGGTESNNIAILGIPSIAGKNILTTEIEHPSVSKPIKELNKIGCKSINVKTDKFGKINIDDLTLKVNADTGLCVFTHINSEIGTIQDIKKICEIVRTKNRNVYIHIDCVQSLGKIRINVKDIKADSMSFSSHKIHGPKGFGAIYLKKGKSLNPIIFGGGQEKGLRPGTENLPSAMSFAKAVGIRDKIMDSEFVRIKLMKENIINDLKKNINDIRINSSDESSPYILNLSIKDIRGEVLLRYLEAEKIFLSTGSACSSKMKKGSVVNILFDDKNFVDGNIRLSFGMFNNHSEVEDICAKIIKHTEEIRKIVRGK
jgi:cysteine desulfurase